MQNSNSHEKLMSEIKLGNIMQCDPNEVLLLPEPSKNYYKRMTMKFARLKLSGHSADIEGDQNNFRCVVCNCLISGQAQAESHAIGMPHEKKLRHKHSASSQLSSIPSSKNNLDETAPSAIAINGSRIGLNSSLPKDFYCNVCNVSLTGEIPYFDHINGKQHMKKVRLSRISYSNDVSPERLDKPIPSLRSSISPQNLAINNKDVQNTLQLVNDMDGMEFCNICNVSLTGKIPMEQHLTGKAHLRRVMLNLRISYSNDVSPERLEKPIPSPHSSISPQNLAINNKDVQNTLQLVNDMDGMEFCNICNVSLTGRIPMEQHLTGKAHLRRVMLNLKGRDSATSGTNLSYPTLLSAKTEPLNINNVNYPTRKTPVEVTPLTLRELQARRATLQETSSPPKATSDVPIFTVKANEPIPNLF